MPKNFNSQSLGEEIANAVSHGVGALLCIAGTVVMIVTACIYSSAIGIVSACLYGASLVLLYTFSTIYHSLAKNKAKRVFQVFDHCSIFILIWGTYIPVSLVLIGGAFGWTLFGIIGFCAIIGIVFNAINLYRWHKFSLVLYVVMGWMAVIGLKSIASRVMLEGIWLLVAGGIAYTLGIIFYKLKRFRYMHFIWHLFVLVGSICHYFFILYYCYILQ